jgi:hypothetical protein
MIFEMSMLLTVSDGLAPLTSSILSFFQSFSCQRIIETDLFDKTAPSCGLAFSVATILYDG